MKAPAILAEMEEGGGGSTCGIKDIPHQSHVNLLKKMVTISLQFTIQGTSHHLLPTSCQAVDTIPSCAVNWPSGCLTEWTFRQGHLAEWTLG